jgi:hypothetical protein
LETHNQTTEIILLAILLSRNSARKLSSKDALEKSGESTVSLKSMKSSDGKDEPEEVEGGSWISSFVAVAITSVMGSSILL